MSGNESKQFNVRLEEDDLRAIDELVTSGEYESASAFIRQAIKDKLNPKLRRARLKKEISDLLKDPDARRELGIE